jgi:hypothetical protein
VYGDDAAVSVSAATLQKARPVEVNAAGLVPTQLTVDESRPTTVKVTVPVARVTGADVVFDGDTLAVNITAWPVVASDAGAVTVVVVAVSAALALNGFRARVDAVATAPAPATMTSFFKRLPIMVPPRADFGSHRHFAGCMRDKRRRCHD